MKENALNIESHPMKIKLTGSYACAYVDELGGSLEVHQPDETCSEVYFYADLEHPDHGAIVDKLQRIALAREIFLGRHMQDNKAPLL